MLVRYLRFYVPYKRIINAKINNSFIILFHNTKVNMITAYVRATLHKKGSFVRDICEPIVNKTYLKVRQTYVKTQLLYRKSFSAFLSYLCVSDPFHYPYFVTGRTQLRRRSNTTKRSLFLVLWYLCFFDSFKIPLVRVYI